MYLLRTPNYILQPQRDRNPEERDCYAQNEIEVLV